MIDLLRKKIIQMQRKIRDDLGIVPPSEHFRNSVSENARQRLDDDPEILCDEQYCPFMRDGMSGLCYGDYCDEARGEYFEVHGIEEVDDE